MQGKPLPYGLQIDRNDILWGSQLAANTLFRLDPASGKSEVFRYHGNSGPRRLALGKDGAIWIPEWNTGYLTSFDPGTRSFKRHRIGSPTIGAYDAEVDPRSGVVSNYGFAASTIIRFDPATGRVDTIPLPTDYGVHASHHSRCQKWRHFGRPTRSCRLQHRDGADTLFGLTWVTCCIHNRLDRA